MRWKPTTDEELKLRLFSGDVSQLGLAERFLKVMINIPFAFKRLEALGFMCSFREEFSSVEESFTTLEVCLSNYNGPEPIVSGLALKYYNHWQ